MEYRVRNNIRRFVEDAELDMGFRCVMILGLQSEERIQVLLLVCDNSLVAPVQKYLQSQNMSCLTAIFGLRGHFQVETNYHFR